MMILSMLKLLRNSFVAFAVSSTLYGMDEVSLLQKYIQAQLNANPALQNPKAKVEKNIDISDKIPGWKAYIVDIDVTLKRNKKNIHQKALFFSNGIYATNDIIDLRSGESIKESIKPPVTIKYYKDQNLIAGDKNAKHKIVVFSDPLCPFCRKTIPNIIKDVQKEPNKFALYYYHLPLPQIHPASEVLTKAVVAAELKGQKVDILNLYTKIQPTDPNGKYYVAYRETNPKKILKVFNEVMGTSITPKDLVSKEVQDRFNEDIKASEELLVGGTPTVYFDGKYDKSKKAYKKVK